MKTLSDTEAGLKKEKKRKKTLQKKRVVGKVSGDFWFL